MGGLSAITDFLLDITPSFRRARSVRNDIKTKYQKNIRNIDSGRPVKTIIHHDTKWLGDRLEKKHMNVEMLYDELGDKQTGGPTVVSEGDRRQEYKIPEENKKVVKHELREIISGIKVRNRISIGLEISMYLIFAAILIIVLLVVTNSLSAISV